MKTIVYLTAISLLLISCGNSKSELEKSMFNNLQKGAPISDYIDFKNKFPDSKYIKSCAIYETIEKIASDSIARKRKLVDIVLNDVPILLGNVKTMYEESRNSFEGYYGYYIEGVVYNFDKNGITTDYIKIIRNGEERDEELQDSVLYDYSRIYKLDFSSDFNSVGMNRSQCNVLVYHDSEGKIIDVKFFDRPLDTFQVMIPEQFSYIDELGNLRRISDSLSDSSCDEDLICLNKYNIEGKLIECKRKYNGSRFSSVISEILDSTIIRYNASDDTKTQYTYMDDLYSIAKLNNIEKLLEYGNINDIDGQDTIYSFRISHKFDKNNNLIESGFINDEGEYAKVSTRKYDERGNLVLYKVSDENYLRELFNFEVYDNHFGQSFDIDRFAEGSRFEYVYDKVGNWTRLDYYDDDNELKETVIRKFEYY